MKQLLFIAILASFGGCSNFTINGTICDQIAQEPNTQAIPQECRKYNEQEAAKAYDKKRHQQQEDVKDIIQFQNDKEQK